MTRVSRLGNNHIKRKISFENKQKEMNCSNLLNKEISDILSDCDRIRRVIDSLIRNAIGFTPSTDIQAITKRTIAPAGIQCL